jgi:tetratricopeptide (TPR) repeat protein
VTRKWKQGSLNFIGVAYVDLGESRQGLNYLFQGKKIYEDLSLPIMNSFRLSNIGQAYVQLNILDSALFFHEQAYQVLTSAEISLIPLRSLILRQLGNVHYKLGNYDKALSNYRQVIKQQ